MCAFQTKNLIRSLGSLGCLDGVKVLGKLSLPGRPTYLDNSGGQVPIALEVGAGGRCLDIFLSSIFSLFFLPFWETVRHRLNTVSKGR